MPLADDTGGFPAEVPGGVGRSTLRERLDALKALLTSDRPLPGIGADAGHGGSLRIPRAAPSSIQGMRAQLSEGGSG